jgi:hypothetical protein
MKRLPGQAGRTIGWVLHHTGMIAITIFFVVAIALGLFAFRLSKGPIEIPWLTSRLASIVSGQGIDIHIQHAALAWGGYHQGGAAPLYLRLGDITARNAEGVELATVRSGRLVFLPSALLGGKAPILVSSTDAYFQNSNVPVAMQAAIQLDGIFSFSRAVLQIQLGAGDLGATGNSVPISGGGFNLAVTHRTVALVDGRVELAPRGHSHPVVGFSGAGQLKQAWAGQLTLTADKVAADDLANYWPQQLAWQCRNWVTGNISAGIGTAAKFVFGLSAPANLADIALDSAIGSFTGTDLDIGWIPRAAPITGVAGVFTLTDQNNIDITARAGTLGGLNLAGGTLHITGVAHRDQDGDFKIPILGKLTGALQVLNAKPLNVLHDAPPQLLLATGDVNGTVSAHLPMRGDVKLNQVDLHVDAAISNVTVPTPAPGLSLTGGTLTLQTTLQRLMVRGTAQLAGQPASVNVSALFQPGQPVIDFLLTSAAGSQLLSRVGVAAASSADDGLSGTVPFTLHATQDSSGATQAVFQADLTKAAASVPALGWSKKPGAAGMVNIQAALDGETVSRITAASATAPGLDIQAATDPQNTARLNFSRLRIGATSAVGSLTAPAAKDKPWRADFSGPALDVTAILNPEPASKSNTPPPTPPKPQPPSGPLWAAKLDFATCILAGHGAPPLRMLDFTGNGQGASLIAASATAAGAAGQDITLAVTKLPGASHPQEIALTTDDGGYMLRALGAYGNVEGGSLDLTATTRDDGTAGTLRLEDFRLLHAPGFTKVLQSLTIYGAAAAASGPGLAFDRLVAPFGMANHVLTLKGARAFSSSLGFTAAGTIDLVSGETDLSTTVIPAYALNALPGKIPIVGKLFSAENGGGLFAVRAHISGQLTDPDVTVNPLSVLTPGVLRDVFGTAPTGAPGK